LFQNVLYDRMSTAKRVQMHQRIGERGEEIYGERVTEIAPELAMHFERSRDYKRAAHYLEQAAHNAIRRFAYREAVALARRGLHLLSLLPDTVERAQQELGLQLTIGLPLAATEGYAHPDVGSAYTRAHELCGRLDETSEWSKVLWGLWAFHMLRAELATAHEIANQFLRLAQNSPRLLTMRGHLALEVTLLNMGDFVQCEEHFQKALSLYNRECDRDDAFLYSQDSGVAICSHGARALWLLGRPDEALKQINEALRLAHETSEPHSLAHAFYFAAFVHHLRGENVRAEECADAAIVLSREHRLPLYEAMSSIIRGSLLFQRGLQSDGIDEIRKGLAEHQATGTQLTRPHYLMLLAEALRKLDRREEALGVLDESIQLAHSRDEAHSLAEIHRIRGEILFDSGFPEHAEEAFLESLTIARRQSAKSWELRSAMSLARLYRYRGQPREAHDLLAQTYDSFTEGLDTADLREVKALLDENCTSDT
jgi:predicted ATPase